MSEMQKSEGKLIEWIASRYPAPPGVGVIGIGDDMAAVPSPAGSTLVASDMLVDGVHFDSSVHAPRQIGRKALAVNLSDCAAMAVRPLYATVSLALPDSWGMDQAKGLFLGMEPLAAAYGCVIVGGDTNAWPHPLVIDVTVIAEPWAGVKPVRRGGMRVGDSVCVTGRLGGSLLGRHVDFEPRVREARTLAQTLGGALHAMIDLSDGLSTDGHHLATASSCAIEIDAALLETVVDEAAREAAARDGRSAIEHVLHDGEDFELLFAVDPAAVSDAAACCPLTRIGTAVEGEGVWLRQSVDRRQPIEPGGWEHWRTGTT